MRCRHFGIRYTMVLMAGQPPACGKEGWWIRRMPAAALAHSHWRPDADVVETVGAITVTVELAGVDEEDVAVLLFEDALVVEGRRELPRCEGDGVYHVAAIRQGPFRIEVPLSVRIDPKGVVARCERGLVWVRLPKANGRGVS
ncbi:MAG: Hsp20/alpha crystallin family protein [Tepidisphaeraceae bacterium]|jgi:HSP20 family protein